MVATATDLLERFGAVTAYTESDEISLVWPPAAPLLLWLTAASRSSCEATVSRKTACACCVRACLGLGRGLGLGLGFGLGIGFGIGFGFGFGLG